MVNSYAAVGPPTPKGSVCAPSAVPSAPSAVTSIWRSNTSCGIQESSVGWNSLLPDTVTVERAGRSQRTSPWVKKRVHSSSPVSWATKKRRSAGSGSAVAEAGACSADSRPMPTARAAFRIREGARMVVSVRRRAAGEGRVWRCPGSVPTVRFSRSRCGIAPITRRDGSRHAADSSRSDFTHRPLCPFVLTNVNVNRLRKAPGRGSPPVVTTSYRASSQWGMGIGAKRIRVPGLACAAAASATAPTTPITG